MASIKERRETAIIQLKKWCEENFYGNVKYPIKRFNVEFNTFGNGLWEPKMEAELDGVSWEDYTTFSHGLTLVRDGAVHQVSINTRGPNGAHQDSLDIQF